MATYPTSPGSNSRVIFPALRSQKPSCVRGPLCNTATRQHSGASAFRRMVRGLEFEDGTGHGAGDGKLFL